MYVHPRDQEAFEAHTYSATNPRPIIETIAILKRITAVIIFTPLSSRPIREALFNNHDHDKPSSFQLLHLIQADHVAHDPNHLSPHRLAVLLADLSRSHG
jgi:hypothetical protein